LYPILWNAILKKPKDYRGKDLWNRLKIEMVTVAQWTQEAVFRWCVHVELSQEESEQDEVDGMKKGVDSAGKVMHI